MRRGGRVALLVVGLVAVAAGCAGGTGGFWVENRTKEAIEVRMEPSGDVLVELDPGESGRVDLDLSTDGCVATLIAVDAATGEEVGRIGPAICPSSGARWKVGAEAGTT